MTMDLGKKWEKMGILNASQCSDPNIVEKNGNTKFFLKKTGGFDAPGLITLNRT